MTGRVSIADILREGFEATKKNANTVIPVFVGLQAAVFLVTYLLNMPILNILMIPIMALMQIAIFKSFKHAYSKFDFNQILGWQEAETKDVFWKLLITYIIYIILIILLFLLLVIPGIIFMVYWFVFPYVVIDQKLSSMDALKKSKQMITGNWWRTFVLFLISAILSVVVTSVVSSISSGNALASGLIMAILSGLVSVYFGYVGVAYYFSLKK